MLELARVKIGPLYVDTVFSDVSIVVIDNTFSCKSNLWNPFPADVNGKVTGLSAPDASFCVASAADAASLI